MSEHPVRDLWQQRWPAFLLLLVLTAAVVLLLTRVAPHVVALGGGWGLPILVLALLWLGMRRLKR